MTDSMIFGYICGAFAGVGFFLGASFKEFSHRRAARKAAAVDAAIRQQENAPVFPLGRWGPPPPMPEVVGVHQRSLDLLESAHRAAKAWNKTQFEDRLRSVAFHLEKAQTALANVTPAAKPDAEASAS